MNGADPECAKHPNGLVPDPDDQNKYFKCNHGILDRTAQDCPMDRIRNVKLIFDVNAQTCVEPPALQCPSPDGIFPVKENKHNFLRCVKGRAEIVACPPLLVFNEKCGYCSYENELNQDCVTEKPTVPTQVTQSGSTATKISSTQSTLSTTESGTCKENEVETDRNDKNKYWVCKSGKRVQMTCADGTQFDDRIRSCAGIPVFIDSVIFEANSTRYFAMGKCTVEFGSDIILIKKIN